MQEDNVHAVVFLDSSENQGGICAEVHKILCSYDPQTHAMVVIWECVYFFTNKDDDRL